MREHTLHFAKRKQAREAKRYLTSTPGFRHVTRYARRLIIQTQWFLEEKDRTYIVRKTGPVQSQFNVLLLHEPLGLPPYRTIQPPMAKEQDA